MFIFYYFLYSIVFIGYGLIFTKIFNLKIKNFGFLGFYGLSFLTFISYITAPFLIHNYAFNILILFFGLLFFLLIFKENFDIKKNFIIHIAVFSILILFIISAKTHDDFPYYHFPYSYLLTQIEHPFGLGSVNPGFRNASSLFFLNSLFYLPITKIYLMNIYSVFFLGFTNIILLSYIFDQSKFINFKLINFLSLISLSFINTFFYRISEHGVDRSGMIIIFLVVVLSTIILVSIKSKKNFEENIDLFYFISVLLTLLASTKSIYLLYLPLGLIFIFFWKSNFLKIFKKSLITYCLIFIGIYLLYNFINSGCIVYPADFICFYNFPWSLSRELVLNDNEWFELWSKAGASPNFVIEDKKLYISNMNWFGNWLHNYFFNKVSDYLLGLLFLIIIFYVTFFRNFHLKIIKNKKFYNLHYLYFFIIIIFLEWFFKHPQLRYGGYHLIALLSFIPFSYYFNFVTLSYSSFIKKTKIILFLVLIIFCGRNIDRIINENQNYKFNPFVNLNFYHSDEIYRYMNYINENIKKNNFSKVIYFGKDFLLTVPKE